MPRGFLTERRPRGVCRYKRSGNLRLFSSVRSASARSSSWSEGNATGSAISTSAATSRMPRRWLPGSLTADPTLGGALQGSCPRRRPHVLCLSSKLAAIDTVCISGLGSAARDEAWGRIRKYGLRSWGDWFGGSREPRETHSSVPVSMRLLAARAKTHLAHPHPACGAFPPHLLGHHVYGRDRKRGSGLCQPR